MWSGDNGWTWGIALPSLAVRINWPKFKIDKASFVISMRCVTPVLFQHPAFQINGFNNGPWWKATHHLRKKGQKCVTYRFNNKIRQTGNLQYLCRYLPNGFGRLDQLGPVTGKIVGNRKVFRKHVGSGLQMSCVFRFEDFNHLGKTYSNDANYRFATSFDRQLC